MQPTLGEPYVNYPIVDYWPAICFLHKLSWTLGKDEGADKGSWTGHGTMRWLSGQVKVWKCKEQSGNIFLQKAFKADWDKAKGDSNREDIVNMIQVVSLVIRF